MVLIKLMKIPPIRHLLGGHWLSPVVTSPLHTDTKRITKYNCRQCHITLNTDEKSESYEIQIQWSRAMRCIYIFLVTGVASCSLVSASRFSCVKLFFISVTISILAQGLVTKVSNFQSEDAIDISFKLWLKHNAKWLFFVVWSNSGREHKFIFWIVQIMC